MDGEWGFRRQLAAALEAQTLPELGGGNSLPPPHTPDESELTHEHPIPHAATWVHQANTVPQPQPSTNH